MSGGQPERENDATRHEKIPEKCDHGCVFLTDRAFDSNGEPNGERYTGLACVIATSKPRHTDGKILVNPSNFAIERP
jgi:hypothetical protein